MHVTIIIWAHWPLLETEIRWKKAIFLGIRLKTRIKVPACVNA